MPEHDPPTEDADQPAARASRRDAAAQEIRRVAEQLGVPSLSASQFARHSRMSRSAVAALFGSWNRAVAAAGLEPNAQGPTADLHKPRIPDDELLQDVLRVTRELGRQPSFDEFVSNSRFSESTYRKRWGSVGKACKLAYARYGFPEPGDPPVSTAPTSEQVPQGSPTASPLSAPPIRFVPPVQADPGAGRRRRVQFGEPIDFRGLRFAPINEQGVVYLFGMVSRELGFLVESIRTEYPDCEAKRCVDPNGLRWEHVLIEFEYRSASFRDHGHQPDGCDLIVCWMHDWTDCPVEVLELKAQLPYLPSR